MKTLLNQIRDCRICEEFLPHGCRPVVQFSTSTKIMIIGQAPGRRVHESGIPWDDPSGDTLRKWLGVDKEAFYNPEAFGILPMGFCYPGTGKSGDLPPRPECAPQWHEQVLSSCTSVNLTLLIGTYAQKQYLGSNRKQNLTQTVQAFEEYLPNMLPLPHPSPRNNIWMKKNPWFKAQVIPKLASIVKTSL